LDTDRSKGNEPDNDSVNSRYPDARRQHNLTFLDHSDLAGRRGRYASGHLLAALRQVDERTRGRNWPTVSAAVDVVSVAFCEDNTPPLKADLNFPYYLATLTYFYRNPEQQTGDYSRRFGDKDEAQAWANSYKGSTFMVHVDPRHPTRSVLREEDL
jgi:hypothetical protein